MKFTKTIVTLSIAVAALGITACNDDQALKDDEATSSRILDRATKNQPVPEFDWSQHRQTLISVLTAQATGQATTSFGLLEGIATPVWQCPSIGFPIPTTSQLTNPDQRLSEGVVVPQIEPNGVYTGESTGTYVVCVDDAGLKYVQYHEGYVTTVGGPAHWETGKGAVLDGKPTVEVKTK